MATHSPPSSQMFTTKPASVMTRSVACVGGSRSRLSAELGMGVSNAALSRFLRQNRGLTLETVDKLAKHLGLRLVRDKS